MNQFSFLKKLVENKILEMIAAASETFVFPFPIQTYKDTVCKIISVPLALCKCEFVSLAIRNKHFGGT
jgi:hypothetical protein